ncbi:hypothetical protein BC360_22955 [Ensifer sp. LC163]|nr:hypothetical protein BC363_27415 [Ensifer sp. LC384]OCP22705.1 hypothetical protein BC361_23855 [Ensifer sp. LC54]OCP37431.1 hypothetical protein BC360_22955 [Ensifer sp. LC163]
MNDRFLSPPDDTSARLRSMQDNARPLFWRRAIGVATYEFLTCRFQFDFDLVALLGVRAVLQFGALS